MSLSFYGDQADQPEFKRLQSVDTKDGNVDRLSNLPLEILHSILASLDTVEVVRTCVLSRRWRNIWTSIPFLKFVMCNYDDDSCQRKWFWKFVESVLLGRNGNHIIKRLHLYYRDFHDGFFFRDKTQSLLRLAAMQTVEELDICTYGEEVSSGTTLTLSRHLSESLKILKVKSRLDISLQVKSEFSNLRSLYLKGITCLEDDTVSQLFLDTLEELHVENCMMEELTVVDISAPNLKKFTFVNRSSYRDEEDYSLQVCVFLGDLKLWAPKLAYFYYSGPVLHSFTLLNLSSLVNARIYFSDFCKATDYKLDMPSIIRELHHVKTLSLSAFALSYFSHSKRTCEFDMLPNLLQLQLAIELTPCNMDQLLYLLKISPNLQTLAIVLRKSNGFNNYLYERDPSWKLLDWDTECLRNSIKVVKVYKFVDSAMETAMVECLLQHGKVLDQIQIAYKDPVKNPDNITQANRQKIESFPKGSGEVTISFH